MTSAASTMNNSIVYCKSQTQHLHADREPYFTPVVAVNGKLTRWQIGFNKVLAAGFFPFLFFVFCFVFDFDGGSGFLFRILFFWASQVESIILSARTSASLGQTFTRSERFLSKSKQDHGLE